MAFNLDNASSVATIVDVVFTHLLLPLASALLGTFIGTSRAQKAFKNKKENRLFSNMARPIAIIPSESDSLSLECRLLKSIEFFNIDVFSADMRSVDEIASHRLAIVRYSNSDKFWHIFERLADKQIPLIIYSKPVEIPPAQLSRIQEYYSRYALCNTPVRLLSDVYAIMSVYPEGRQ